MKEFIKTVLNKLGFGINGVMTQDLKMFGGRIEDYFAPFKVTLQRMPDTEDKDINKCEYKFDNGNESFYAMYTFTKSLRIINLEIYG